MDNTPNQDRTQTDTKNITMPNKAGYNQYTSPNFTNSTICIFLRFWLSCR